MQTSHPVLLSPFIYLVIYLFPSLFCKMDLSPFLCHWNHIMIKVVVLGKSRQHTYYCNILCTFQGAGVSRHESTSISDREF